jgi:hypothetical protein
LSAATAGLAAAMQGATYAFPARAIPLLTQDLEMGLTPEAASWFGKLLSPASTNLVFLCNSN